MKIKTFLFIGIYPIILLTSFNVRAQSIFPNLSVKDSLNQSHEIHDLLNSDKGYKHVISFFASWCSPCIHDAKKWNECFKEWEQIDSVRLIFLCDTMDDELIKSIQFFSSNGFDYKIYATSFEFALQTLQVTGYPTNFFLNTQGVIVSSTFGVSSCVQIENEFDKMRKLYNLSSTNLTFNSNYSIEICQDKIYISVAREYPHSTIQFYSVSGALLYEKQLKLGRNSIELTKSQAMRILRIQDETFVKTKMIVW